MRVGVGVGQWKRERESALRRGVRLEIKWLALNVTITLYFSLLTSQADGCQEGDRGELMGRKNTAVWFVALEWRCLLGKSLELVKYVSKHLVLFKGLARNILKNNNMYGKKWSRHSGQTVARLGLKPERGFHLNEDILNPSHRIPRWSTFARCA